MNYEITEICYKEFCNVAFNFKYNRTLLNSQNHVLCYSGTARNRIPKKVKLTQSYSTDEVNCPKRQNNEDNNHMENYGVY